MQYRRLGRCGLQLSELSLGSWVTYHNQIDVGTAKEMLAAAFDAGVQARIQRVQDNTRTEANLRWLVQHTQAHVHADLIFGLPGESLAGFARGFDRLLALGPHEIQLGVLKRLRGTPLARMAS